MAAVWRSTIPLEPAQLESLLLEWWQRGESSCPPSLKLTLAQAVPLTDLPSRASGRYRVLRWDLSKISPALAGCAFEVDAQKFTDRHDAIPGSYRVRGLRAGCVGKPLRIGGIWFPVSGQTQAYENYFDSVEAVLPALSDPSQLAPLSAGEGILIERVEGGDSLSVGFVRIGETF